MTCDGCLTNIELKRARVAQVAERQAQRGPSILDRIKAGIASPGEAVGVYTMVADYNSVDRYRRFAADLQKRGWSQARLEKLMGGNFLRVYREAWGG